MRYARPAFALTTVCLTSVVALLVFVLTIDSRPTPSQNFFRAEHARPKVGNAGDETVEALNAAEEYAQARQAPGLVLPGAYSAAFASLTALPH